MKKAVFLCLAALFICLGGCNLEDDDLLQLPQLPQQYVLLQEQLDRVLVGGAQLSAPVSGTNRSAIQMVDLTGDGTDETLAFVSTKKNDSVVLQVYIYGQERGKYAQLAILEGVGDSFDLVEYPRIGLQQATAVVVGWRLGQNPVRGLSIYLYEDGKFKSIYSDEYTGLLVEDLDHDQTAEFLVMRHSPTSSTGLAKLVRYESGRLAVAAQTQLSAGISSPAQLLCEQIAPGETAVIVDAQVNESGFVTDLLQFTGGRLQNLLFDASRRASAVSYRAAAYLSRDINGDGIVEIPLLSRWPGKAAAAEEDLYRVDWCVWDGGAGLRKVFSSYHDEARRWYFMIPETLLPSITVERSQFSEDVDSVVFREYNSETETAGAPLWAIYYVTGIQRYTMAEEMGLFELARTPVGLYGALIFVKEQDNIIHYQELAERFALLPDLQESQS